MLTFELVRIGDGGRARCAACGGASGTAVYRSLIEVTQDIEAAIERSQSPGPDILLGGADAFGHPELPAIVAAAVHAGAARIALDTDGGALATGGNAAGAMHAGVRHVRLGFGDPRRALAGAKAWAAAAGASGVDTVSTCRIEVCRHNAPELAQAIADLAAAGVAGVVLVVQGVRVDEATARCLVAACDTGMVNGIWVEVVGPDGALPDSHRLHRAGDGR